MKTNTPDQPKTNPPDSDQSARKSNASMSDEMVADAVVESTDLQTSHKTGKHSTVEKLAASRPNTGPAEALNRSLAPSAMIPIMKWWDAALHRERTSSNATRAGAPSLRNRISKITPLNVAPLPRPHKQAASG